MDISIIIPNYNGVKLLEKHLPKVIEAVNFYKNGEVEIVIIDDGSIDDSISIIESIIKSKKVKLKLLQNKKNLGFSSTVDKGVSEAKGEVIVLLNTDVVPEINLLNKLIVYFEDPEIFAVGCLDKSVEKEGIVERGRGLGNWNRGFLIHRRGEVNKTNTLWVNGGSGAFKKSIWEKLGGFNELYDPFYWEDIDLSYRALKSGYKIMFDSECVVWHYHEQGAIKNKYSPFQIKTIAYRNQFIFVWENITDLSLRFSHLFWLPYHLARALLSRDWSFFLGFLHAFVLLPKIVKFSLISKKLFMISDSKLLKQFI